MPQEEPKKKGKATPPSQAGRKRVKRIQEIPLEGLVVLAQVLLHYPVGKSTLYKEIREGTFPSQKGKKGRSVFWDVVEVSKHLRVMGANIEIPGTFDEPTDPSGHAKDKPEQIG